MMRAKFRVTKVETSGTTTPAFETVSMMAVSEKPFDQDGNSEDNSFARWTPSGELKMAIQNPALFGKLKEGQTFYLDFTKVETPTAVPA
ncbi:MAG TPA: hypothetical protein VGF13_01175 [Verrucomicrobiae bacterium]|jgi:hypothetical protein